MNAHVVPPGYSDEYADGMDFAVHCWAERVIARSILWLDGVIDLQTALAGSWDAAVKAGLVDEFGADEIKDALRLVFGGGYAQ
jgi:hypothetical protein